MRPPPLHVEIEELLADFHGYRQLTVLEFLADLALNGDTL